jgi:hypothetical protein
MRIRSITVLSLIAVFLFVFFGWLPSPVGNAQNPVHRWTHLEVLTYADTLVGFFDTKNGKLYLYNSGFDHPAQIREIVELGKPLKEIKE